MKPESFDLQIYLAYLEYKLDCKRTGMHFVRFATFRSVALDCAEMVNRWLMIGSSK